MPPCEPALDKLQALRDRLGKPLIVRSAYRSPEHNRAVGGATRSKHLDGAAFDIAMANHDPVAFEAAARRLCRSGPHSCCRRPQWRGSAALAENAERRDRLHHGGLEASSNRSQQVC